MSENRTLAKNSLILYTRLIITTIIGLYASRVILLELGAYNFGLYTIVGGLIAMLNMLNTTMVSTSNRYIAVELGKNDKNNVNKVFNTLFVIHILFSGLLIIIVEIAGVWYIKNYLNIDKSQINNALFVLHMSTLSAAIGTLIIPFQGLVNAFERFNIRAGIETLQSFLNLGIVLLLTFTTNNKLRVYAVYVLMIQVVVSLLYYIYCKNKFRELTSWKLNRNKKDYTEISTFFGWQLVYVAGSVGSTQGGALIMNMFFGTVLNAAFGIAQRVNEFVFSFVKNLNQAAVPQIMKSFSGGNQERSLQLVYKLSKYTFFIMLIPAVPIILSINTILILWLKIVPPYTAIFVVLRIIHGLISCLESGFDANIDATGRIKSTKIFFTVIFLSILPIVYFLYKTGMPPYIISIGFIVGEVIFLIYQLRILSVVSKFKFSDYWRFTLLPVFYVSVLLIPQFFIPHLFQNIFINFLVVSALSVILTLLTVYFIGLTKNEKEIIAVNIKNLYSSKIKKMSLS